MKPIWAERLSQLVAEQGWKVTEYHRRINADSSLPEIGIDSVRKYLKGKVAQPRGDILKRLGAPFGKSELELVYGISNADVRRENRIPLLTAAEVGTLNHAQLEAWGGRSMDVFSNDVGERWFGVIVPDDACAPKIPRGSTAYCDPGAKLRPQDYVIAQVPGLPEGVCRRFRQIDGFSSEHFQLVPENEDYPTYESTPEKPITAWRVVRVLSDPY